MPFYRNKNSVKINSDVTAANRYLVDRGDYTSILFAESDGKPTHDINGLPIVDDRWEECDKTVVSDLGCVGIFTLNGVRYYGYL